MHGLLWREIKAGRFAVPRQEELILAKLELKTRAKHQQLWRSLETVIARFENMDLHVATAKGVTAEARWFPGLGTRPSTDVDILLKPSDVERAATAVETMGRGHQLADTVNTLARIGHLQSVDLRDESGTHIDLHFDILKWEVPTRQNQLIWDRCQYIELPSGGEARVLDPEVSLILFLLHLNKDRFSYLLGYVDVVRLIEQEDLDWDFIDRFARMEGLETHLYLTLEAVFETLRMPVPPHRTPTGWRSAAWRRLWPESLRLRGHIGRVSHPRRQYWIGSTARGRALESGGRWLRRLFPPRSLLDYYHPDMSGPYLWHLIKGRLRSRREHHELTAKLD